jgi:hypothetical protein
MSYIKKYQKDHHAPWFKKSCHTIFADDESTEASIRQRIGNLEYNLFDEYWDELITYRQQIGLSRARVGQKFTNTVSQK